MMRFHSTPQMDALHHAIKATLSSRGLDGIRADDRDYTGEIWRNILLCMSGCNLGIAVFEDIDMQDHDQNVTLELGYMMALGHRYLILKEIHSPALPTTLSNVFYKPFNRDDIQGSVARSIDRWLTVDLAV
jgi:nucleoside 2-deoxyribosyltransferase